MGVAVGEGTHSTQFLGSSNQRAGQSVTNVFLEVNSSQGAIPVIKATLRRYR